MKNLEKVEETHSYTQDTHSYICNPNNSSYFFFSINLVPMREWRLTINETPKPLDI